MANPKIRILDYKESIQKLSDLVTIIKEKMQKMENEYGSYLPSISFFLALQVQAKVIDYLNDEALNYGLAWDEDTGFPSLPSLVADVGSYVRHFNPQGKLRILLESFCGWSLFEKEEMLCCCSSFKLRKVALEIMLNHVLEIQESSVVIKQILGVRTDDLKHLEQHYDLKKPSQRIDNLNIIWLCRNEIKNNGSLKIEYLGSEHAEQFNFLGFQNRIMELI
jgi:hypothetical protein